MFKVLFIIVVSISTVFAASSNGGGGGSVFPGGGHVDGSFGSYQNSDKFGLPQVIKDTSSLGGNLNLITYTHVRAKNWLTVLNWESGYATSEVKKDGIPQIVEELEIRQYSIANIRGNEVYLYSSKRVVNKKNTSKVMLGLSEVDPSGVVVTQHLFRINGKTYENRLQKDWGGQGVTFPIYSNTSKDPRVPKTEWKIYPEPVPYIAKKLLL